MKNIEHLKNKYPNGTIIELEEMAGEGQMPCGLKGTVKFVDDMGQIHVDWENGSSLALNIDEDSFKKIEQTPKLSVLLVEPGKYPRMIDIDDSLEAMQETVGGYIECLYLEDDVALICNEEGKMNGLPLNRAIYFEHETDSNNSSSDQKSHTKDNSKKEMIDIIAGPFFVCYASVESENFSSLPKEFQDKYMNKFKFPEHFIKKVNGDISAVPFRPREHDIER